MADQGQGPGTVAVTFSSDAARYSDFTKDLEALELPEGTVKDFETSPDASAARNALVERALERGSYWIWFISEDHSFPPDIVTTLLSRDKQITAPVVLSTTAPVHALVYKGVSRANRRLPVQLDGVIGPGTLIEIEAAVAAGLLIRRAVFEDLPKPWFPNEVDDELLFCDEALRRGFEPFLDTSARLGNRCTAAMYPTHRAGKWELSVAVGDDIELSVPIERS